MLLMRELLSTYPDPLTWLPEVAFANKEEVPMRILLNQQCTQSNQQFIILSLPFPLVQEDSWGDGGVGGKKIFIFKKPIFHQGCKQALASPQPQPPAPAGSFLLLVKQRGDPCLRVGPTEVSGGCFWGGGQDCRGRMLFESERKESQEMGGTERPHTRTRGKKKAIKLMQVGCHKVIDISRAEQFTVWKRRQALA